MKNSLEPKYDFDSFHVDQFNSFAHAVAMSISKDDRIDYNPTLIYGKHGLGKSHLLHAIGNAILRRSPEMNILCTSALQINYDLIYAVNKRKKNDFIESFKHVDLLLIDDIQFISGKPYVLQEFYSIFSSLYEKKCQTVFTSDRHPREINDIGELLISKFSKSLVADIECPVQKDNNDRVRELIQKTVSEYYPAKRRN
jgi:chromosomal replication initiator protein